jgi:hypothetical protein
MHADASSQRSSHLARKEVQLRLRGGASIQGLIHIPEGQPLLHFLGLRKHFLNLTSARYLEPPQTEEPLAHLSVRLSNVVWVIPLDVSLHVSAAASPVDSSRMVELQLVDDLTLNVILNLAEEQRMSDYLDSNVAFIPLWDAKVLSSSRVIERLAVNHEAILATRELRGDRW